MDLRGVMVVGMAVVLSVAGCASDGDKAPSTGPSASESSAQTSASPAPTRAAATPSPTPTPTPTASQGKSAPRPTRSTGSAEPAPSAQPPTGTPSPTATGFPTLGDALAAYLASKDRVYAGPCETTDISQDIGKTCSKVVEDRGGEVVLLVGEAFSEFDSYVLVRASDSGWLVVRTAAVPYPDDDGTLPF